MDSGLFVLKWCFQGWHFSESPWPEWERALDVRLSHWLGQEPTSSPAWSFLATRFHNQTRLTSDQRPDWLCDFRKHGDISSPSTQHRGSAHAGLPEVRHICSCRMSGEYETALSNPLKSKSLHLAFDFRPLRKTWSAPWAVAQNFWSATWNTSQTLRCFVCPLMVHAVVEQSWAGPPDLNEESFVTTWSAPHSVYWWGSSTSFSVVILNYMIFQLRS